MRLEPRDVRDDVWGRLSNVGALQRTCAPSTCVHPTQPPWATFRETLNFGVFQHYRRSAAMSNGVVRLVLAILLECEIG